MTEKEMLCVRALRICHSNEDCRDCEFMESDRDEKSCVNILFEDAAEIIESLSKRLESAQPKWISVEERLPGDNDDVLVRYVHSNGKRYHTVGNYLSPFDTWFTDIDNDVVIITHWMPLPEAPKEE